MGWAVEAGWVGFRNIAVRQFAVNFGTELLISDP